MNKKDEHLQKLATVKEIFNILASKAVEMAREILAEDISEEEIAYFEGNHDQYELGPEYDGTEEITDQEVDEMAAQPTETQDNDPEDIAREQSFKVSKKELPPIEDLRTNPAFAPENFPYEIPEEKILEAAKIKGGINNYTRLLYAGSLFKAAGMTPIYLTNAQESIIRVSASEIWNKVLQ